MLEQQAAEASGKLDEANRTLNDFETAKKKLTLENADYTRQVSNTSTTHARGLFHVTIVRLVRLFHTTIVRLYGYSTLSYGHSSAVVVILRTHRFVT